MRAFILGVAEQILPEVFQQLFAATREPFIQPIYDLWCRVWHLDVPV